jgi:hypothetical protein
MRSPPRFISLALVFALSALGAACADPEEKAVDNYIEGADGYARSVCRCDFGNPVLVARIPAYNSEDSCLKDFPADSAKIGCVEGVFKDEPTDYHTSLDCMAGAYRQAATCINGATCEQNGTRIDCYNELADSLDACPQLANDVQERLNNCLGV